MVPLGQGDAGLLSLCLPLSGLRPTDLMVLFGGITALGGGGGGHSHRNHCFLFSSIDYAVIFWVEIQFDIKINQNGTQSTSSTECTLKCFLVNTHYFFIGVY